MKENHRKKYSGAIGASFAVLVLLVVATFLLWQLFSGLRDEEVAKNFDARAESLENMLQNRIAALENLASVYRGLFSASNSVTEEEFSSFFETLSESQLLQGLRGIGYAVIVEDDQIDSFIASARAEGIKDFDVFRTSTADQHIIVKYAEPHGKNQAVIGFDLSIDPIRYGPAQKALSAEGLSATPELELELPGEPLGVLLYASTQLSGSFEPDGVVVLVVETESFLSDVLKDFTDLGLEISVYDNTIAQETLLYNSQSNSELIDLTSERSLTYGDREWIMRTQATRDFQEGVSPGWISAMIILVGLTISLLVFALLYAIATSQKRAVEIAGRITNDLSKTKRRMEQLVEASPDPIVILDKLGRITIINRATERASGYSRSELLGKFFPKIGIVAPASIPTALRHFATIMAGKHHDPYEITVRRKNGTSGVFEINAEAWKEGGKLQGVQVILRDVTSRKKNEEELVKQKEELERVNKFMVGRELKMSEMKKEIDELRKKLSDGQRG